jgi:hypothetical protein
MVRMGGKHVIHAEIHTCHDCRFSGTAHDFLERTITEHMVRRYFEEVAFRIHDEPEGARAAPSGRDAACRKELRVLRTPLPHVQYYWAALAAPALGLTAVEAGKLFTRAYWCLRLEPSARLAKPRLQAWKKLFLREAIGRLRQGLQRERSGPLVYLVAELCRRSGRFSLSRRYFESFLKRAKGPMYLRQAAVKLLEAARARDAGHKTMEEILYDQPQDSRRGE